MMWAIILVLLSLLAVNVLTLAVILVMTKRIGTVSRFLEDK